MKKFAQLLLKTALFEKLANEKILEKLKSMDISNDIKDFVLSLDAELLPFAIGFIIKHQNASLEEVKSHIAQKQRIQSLKQETKNKINSELDGLINDPKIKEWAIIQIKKYPNQKDLLINNIDKIISLKNDYDIDLPSYNIEEAIDLFNNLNKLSFTNHSVAQVLSRYETALQEKTNSLHSDKLIKWVSKVRIPLFKDWEKQIVNYMKVNNKSLHEIMDEAKTIVENFNQGAYRNQEIPNTPLRNHLFDDLMINLETMDRWVQDTQTNISSMSLTEAFEQFNEWSQEQINKNNLASYDPLDKNKIVWTSPDKQYFIVELISKKDLETEGILMHHCVGTYFEKVERGGCRIFSLRNVSNIYKPIITVETDRSMMAIRQDHGYGDKPTDSKYHDMITEWNQSLFDEGNFNFAEQTIDDLIELANTRSVNLLTKLTYYVINNLKDYHNLSGFREIIDNILTNPFATPEILNDIYHKILSKIRRPFLVEMLLLNPNCPSELFVNIYNTYQDNTDIVKALAKNPNTPLELLKKLTETPFTSVKELVAKNPNSSAEVLEKLLTSNLQILNFIAKHHNASENILKKLMPHKYLHPFIANNPNLSPELVISLLQNGDRQTVINVLRGDKVNSNILNRYSRSNDPLIRNAVAGNKNTPIDTLLRLSNDEDLMVKETVAKNPNTPTSIVDKLLKSEDVAEGLARSNRTPIELLRKLKQHSDPNIAHIAENTIMYHYDNDGED